MTGLAERYRAYVGCLNDRDLDRLGDFVREDVQHNGNAFGLAGYRDMMLADYRSIPDLRFEIEMLVVDPTHVAARVVVDGTPIGDFHGLAVNGRRVVFHENAIYTWVDDRISDVRSVIDTAAIAAQLAGG